MLSFSVAMRVVSVRNVYEEAAETYGSCGGRMAPKEQSADRKAAVQTVEEEPPILISPEIRPLKVRYTQMTRDNLIEQIG